MGHRPKIHQHALVNLNDGMRLFQMSILLADVHGLTAMGRAAEA
jgi:hypothetical protein